MRKKRFDYAEDVDGSEFCGSVPLHPFRCPINNMFTSNLSHLFAVSSAIQAIQNVNITEGRDLTLLCNVSGIPPPVVLYAHADWLARR